MSEDKGGYKSPSQLFLGCHAMLPQKNYLLGEHCMTFKKQLRGRLGRLLLGALQLYVNCANEMAIFQKWLIK